MSSNLIIIGGGGHCKSIIDVVELEGKYDIKGILDDNLKMSDTISNYSVIGDWFHLELDHFTRDNNFLIGVGNIEARKKLFERLIDGRQNIPVVISPKATVSINSGIRTGSIIMHNAVVNSGAVIGNNCIINTGAIIEHDCIIGDNCHIAVGAILIGGIKICNDVMVGAGAVVTKNITEPGIYIGVPAKKYVKA